MKLTPTHSHHEDGVHRWWWGGTVDGWEGRVEFSRRYSFGLGVMFSRSGMEEDVQLALYAGKAGSLWLSLRHPWAKRLRVTEKSRDGISRYEARETGFRLSTSSPWLDISIEHPDMSSSKRYHWWRTLKIDSLLLFGRWRHVREERPLPPATVELPEGTYDVELTECHTISVPVSWRGRVRNLFRPERIRKHVSADVPGGIPIWGKGENSWDCGMDGLFGTGGDTVEDALSAVERNVLRSRERYGGPDDLPRAMTVSEASEWFKTARRPGGTQ